MFRARPQPRRQDARPRACVWLRSGLLLLAAACGADDDEPPDPNPSFDQWCDGGPCGWQVDLGAVQRVSTWHEHDYAVEFEGPGDVQLSQLRPTTSAQCLSFDMVARVDADAHLSLHVDFNDDGVDELSQVAPMLDWKSVPFTIATPSVYDGVRFTLSKTGPGKAVIAQIVISGEDTCPDFPLRLEVGSRCEEDFVCKSLACIDGICQRAEAMRPGAGTE